MFFEKEESKIIHREIKLKMWIKPSESSAFIILITDNFISRILQYRKDIGNIIYLNKEF